MYSLDANIQTALDRKAELMRTVQTFSSTEHNQSASHNPSFIWPTMAMIAVFEAGLVLFIR